MTVIVDALMETCRFYERSEARVVTESILALGVALGTVGGLFGIGGGLIAIPVLGHVHGTQLCSQFITVHSWHIDVREDQVELGVLPQP